jgi:ribosomal protein S18 acetylase RimI-like enzyme
MRRSDLAFAAECARASGRITESAEELESFLASDPRGCWIALERLHPVGFCVARSYATSGFLGAMVVDHARNPRQLEMDLLERAVKYLKSFEVDNFYAEVPHTSVKSYERAGFVKVARIVGFDGKVYGRSHWHVRGLHPTDLTEVLGLDRHAFRANRLALLGQRLAVSAKYCKVLEANGKMGGFIMARRGSNGIAVGPWVVSSDVDCPADLLESLASEAKGERLYIEVLESNTAAVELLRTLGFAESTQEIWRMRLGKPTSVGQASSLFAVASPFMG